MAFTPRTFPEILSDMIDYVNLQADLTDSEIGSIIRSILEASALEDDEQYFQMVQLLDAFKLSSSTGSLLDGRLQEYNLERLLPAAATGTLIILDGLLTTTELAANALIGATSLTLDDSSEFPTSGFPETIRVGEGTPAQEDLAILSNNTTTGVVNLFSGCLFEHDIGERVSLVTGASDRTLNPGIRAQVPASGGNESIVVVTVEGGILVNGNYESSSIQAKAEVPGSTTIIAGRVTQFVTSPPFDGAAVTNTQFSGGRDLEQDDVFRDRGRESIQSLSKATVLALKTGVVGVSDPVTGQKVVTSNVVESFVDQIVTVYVDDGTGFTPDSVELARTTLASSEISGVTAFDLVDASDFPQEGFALVSPENASQSEIVEFSGVASSTMTLTAATQNAHDSGDEIVLVDVLTSSAEAGQSFFQFTNFPIIGSTYRVWVDDGTLASPILQVEGVDYVLNRGNGQIEFVDGLSAGSVAVAAYSYYTGLLFEVQKTINGVLDDSVEFPGIRAAGIMVNAATPTIRRINVRIFVTAAPGFQKNDLLTAVADAVAAYINSLGVGADVIRSEIIERAMGINGVADVNVTIPATNIVVLEDELPVPVDTNGDSLVVVT